MALVPVVLGRMNANDQLATVLRLACLTEDRTDSEQRALIEIAWKVDREHNKLTSLAIRAREAGWEPWNLVQLVMDTRDLSDFPADKQRDVKPPKGWDKRWDLWRLEGGMVR